MKVTWSWGVLAGMSPELAVLSLQLRPSFLRRLFGEHLWWFSSSKPAWPRLLTSALAKKLMDLTLIHSQRTCPIKPGSLIYCSLPFSCAEGKAILLGEKEKSCSKAAREGPRADHLLIHTFTLWWDKPHSVAQPGPGGHCSSVPHGWSLAAITFQLRELQ